MKKVLSIFTVVLLFVLLVGCGKKNDGPKSEYDLGGIPFVIMCDNAAKCDPRSSTYERLFKDEKVAKINEVEEKYNVKVQFKDYPSNASWGGARERYIIEESTQKTQSVHVYEIISTSIGNLAEQKAIVPLDDYIEAYGSEYAFPEKQAFGLVKGKHYGYDDQYPIADKGLYYNVDLLGRILGDARKNEPLTLWENGEWNWAKFKALAEELNGKLDHERKDEDGGAQYVFGGRTYNWAYGFFGANAGRLVDDEFNTYLTSQPILDTLEYLNSLYAQPGMWIDDAALSNTSQPQFTAGNVAFQDGESWHIAATNKWGNAKFKINYVPFPVGPNVSSDLSNYNLLTVGGKSTYVISSSFSKANIPAGYEDLMIHDETIFKIWSELQYFPESIDDIKADFYSTRLYASYESEQSRQIHLDMINRSFPDNFYSVMESQNQNDTSYMIMIQQSVRDGDIRNVMLETEASLRATLIEKFNLGANYYN